MIDGLHTIDQSSKRFAGVSFRMGRNTSVLAWLRMDARSILALAVSLVVSCGGSGQNIPKEEKPTVEKIRALGLQHASGPVPVYYSTGFEARALKYQKTLVACQQWYDREVGKHVDFTLAVLSKADWQKTTPVAYPMPHNVGVYQSLPPPGGVLPARFEDFPNSAEFTDNPELLVENIAFHELGHIYAHFIDMETDDNLLAEIYANIFMVSRVRAQRRDMLLFLQGPSAKLPPERYTSMEDVQYLAGDVGMTNYGWFEFQIYRLADLLLKDKPLPQLLAELKKAFHDPTRRPFNHVAAQLETMRPGIGKQMGALWKPTTIPDAPPKPCSQTASSGKDSDLVVLNLSSKPVKITSGKDAPVVVSPNSWYTFGGHAGELVQINASACFAFGDEPTVARIATK